MCKIAQGVLCLACVTLCGCQSRLGEPCGGADDGPCGLGAFCQTEVGACGGEGQCAEVPEICTLDFNPVCGCDGETYSNACAAASAAVSIDHQGACDQAVCCNPAQQPGVGGSPPCFEGSTCCADGTWACNRGDGTPTCEALGQICDAGA